MDPSSKSSPSDNGVTRKRYWRLTRTGLLALPAALTIFLAFNAGGYFVDGTAAAAVVVGPLSPSGFSSRARGRTRGAEPWSSSAACSHTCWRSSCSRR
jgi:hypothetical protein